MKIPSFSNTSFRPQELWLPQQKSVPSLFNVHHHYPLFMAYNEDLGLRLEQLLADYEDITAKKMFGGLCFLYRNKMCVGVVKDNLMVRVVSEKFAEELARPYAREMDFTGRTMKNFLFIEPEGLVHDDQLKHFIQLGIEHAEQAAAR